MLGVCCSGVKEAGEKPITPGRRPRHVNIIFFYSMGFIQLSSSDEIDCSVQIGYNTRWPRVRLGYLQGCHISASSFVDLVYLLDLPHGVATLSRPIAMRHTHLVSSSESGPLTLCINNAYNISLNDSSDL